MRLRRTLALSLLLGVGAPVPALADGMIIPFIGVNFAGNSGKELSRAVMRIASTGVPVSPSWAQEFSASRRTSHTVRISTAGPTLAAAAC